MKKIYSLVMALCVALCASATPFQGLVKQDLKLHHSVAEFATGIQKAPAATQGLQYDATAGELTRYYNETDQVAIDAKSLSKGLLYMEIMASDYSDCLVLAFCVKDTVKGAVIPEGTYAINNTGAEGTALASKGYNQMQGVTPCAYFPVVVQNNELYISTPMYFMVSGTITVKHVNGTPKITINAVNSNNVPMTIVYEVGGESGIVNPKLQYDEQTGSVNRTYTDKDELIIDDTYMYGNNLYVDITAADNTDGVSLLFFVPAVDPVIGIPAGTYPIVANPAMNTVLASTGITAQGGVSPSFYGTLVEEGGQLYMDKLWFFVSGQVVVENINGKLKMTIDAVNSYDVPVKIVYNAAGANTAVDNVAVENNVSKVLENGQIFIMKDGVKYNAIGSVVK